MKEISLEELKQIEYDILLSIDNFCQDNNLIYYLWGGTLLGAVRHHGFIPWDDDIDIAMPRKDYEIFVRKYNTPIYGVYSSEINKNYPYTFAKAFDKRTRKIEPIRYSNQFSIGVDVDIFPLDAYDNNKSYPRLVRNRRIMLDLWRWSITEPSKIKSLHDIAKNILIYSLKTLSNQLSRRINDLSRNIDSNDKIMLSADSNIDEPLIFSNNWFGNGIKLIFENHEFICPIDYDKVLWKCYGNYMELPPKEKRVPHHTSVIMWKEGA